MRVHGATAPVRGGLGASLHNSVMQFSSRKLPRRARSSVVSAGCRARVTAKPPPACGGSIAPATRADTRDTFGRRCPNAPRRLAHRGRINLYLPFSFSRSSPPSPLSLFLSLSFPLRVLFSFRFLFAFLVAAFVRTPSTLRLFLGVESTRFIDKSLRNYFTATTISFSALLRAAERSMFLFLADNTAADTGGPIIFVSERAIAASGIPARY